MNLRSVAWKVHRHLRVTDDVGALRKLCGRSVTDAEVGALLQELAGSDRLADALRTPEAKRWFGTADVTLATQLALDGTGRGRALFLYVAARLLTPTTVVETGCFTGWDSAVILEALERNGAGRLFTIDLPAEEGTFSQLRGHRSGLVPGLEPGFLVPDALRRRWTLTLGDVRHELVPLLESLGTVDVFFHDSHHTYDHMMWEFTTVWPYLSQAGIVASDDISWNRAIHDFARGLGQPLAIRRGTPNLGALRKGSAQELPAPHDAPAVAVTS